MVETSGSARNRRMISQIRTMQLLMTIALASSSLVAIARPIQGQESDTAAIEFNRDIRPLFIKHCTACHGGVKQAADVSFVYANQVIAPDGWIVEPGKPEESLLIERVRSQDPEERMPPPEHGPGLKESEINLLTRWIKEGAKWQDHWAFEPPRPVEVPATDDRQWPREMIDHFVLAKLETKKIKPAGEALPELWLRRVSMDLIGLPPTLKEREIFLQELASCKSDADVENAYSKVVDRLLASPFFGERWASVWLDQVRYADSKGLGFDSPRNIWKYRDWVIDAFNRDLPYDQFTIKQLAGDLLPEATIEDHVATAAHRLTQTNEEGGTDDEEFRIMAVLDRINTTWQAWQGVTFGCVQCHSHPYDPIRHDEYYKFAAFFNNTADSDLGEDWPVVNAPSKTADYQKASQLDREIAKLKQEIWQQNYDVLLDQSLWKPVIELAAKTNNDTVIKIDSVADHAEFRTVGTVSNSTDITLTATIPKELESVSAIRLTGMPLDLEKAITDSEWGFSVSHLTAHWIIPGSKEPEVIEIDRLIADEAEPFFDPNESLNPKSNRGFAAYTRIYRPRSTAIILKFPAKVPEGASLQIVLKHRISALGAFPLVTKRGHLAVTDSSAFEQVANGPLKEKQAQLNSLQTQRQSIQSTSVPVLKERPEHLSRTQQVFIRGLYLTKDKTVEANTPEAFDSLSQQGANDRLALAKWLVRPENPLTARVAINRLWARMFGTGIVATEEDFGSSGEPPSHPKLLDHLALKFQNEYRWSQKKVLREIALSSTYRQSSVIRPEVQESDPANRLLARGPRIRLSSEMVRDQALAISGLLSKKQYGAPVRPPIPAGVWKPFAGWDKWNTAEPDSEDRYRRAIYVYMKRSIPFPIFAAFDAPSREVCAPRRLQSNTPIQALMNLNDQTMIDCAEAFAKRMQSFDTDSQQSAKASEKIRKGFVLATCREPKTEELATLVQLLESYEADEQPAGWEAVASVLLNLDEVLTK